MSDSELSSLFKESSSNDDLFTIGTTVDTGFEWEASDEYKEKFGKNMPVVKERGKIYFNISWDQFAKVHEMRSIDNIFIVADVQTLPFGQTDKEADLQLFVDAVHKNMNLNKTLDAWKRATSFKGKLYPTKEEYTAAKEQILLTKTEALEMKSNKEGQDSSSELKEDKGGKEQDPSESKKDDKKEGQDPSESKEDDKKEGQDPSESKEDNDKNEGQDLLESKENNDKKREQDLLESKRDKGKKRGQDPSASKEEDLLAYRVTCERTGKHKFESGDIARVVGGELQDKYLWIVDLSTYYLEIVCKLIENELITHLRVTHESKHRRNIVSFGPTTLRSTICYSMLRLASPKPGDIIIDPMCGGGSIPIEAALAYPHAYILCGDKHPEAMTRTKSNIDASAAKRKIDPVYWSAKKLPFKDSFADIIVTDMPFGKRSGRMSDNKILYKQFLLELGRMVKSSSGRLVLLTYDRQSFKLALQEAGNMFWVVKTICVNIGGLHAVVYVLNRTNVSHTNYKPRPIKQYNKPMRSSGKNSSYKPDH